MALSVDDRLEIRELAARYNHALDVWDTERWVDCFTEDGRFDGGPKLQASGRDELVAFVDRLRERGRPAQHWTNSPIIEGDGDAATMRIYLLVVNLSDEPGEGARIGPLGTYENELVRVDGAWKFKRRSLR